MTREGRWRGWAAASVLGSLLVGACAPVGNTTEQELAYQRWRTCETQVSGVQIHQIEPGGRILFWHLGSWDRARTLECLARAETTEPKLPEALPLQVPRGP
jgi:hypothetical protein